MFLFETHTVPVWLHTRRRISFSDASYFEFTAGTKYIGYHYISKKSNMLDFLLYFYIDVIGRI